MVQLYKSMGEPAAVGLPLHGIVHGGMYASAYAQPAGAILTNGLCIADEGSCSESGA
jgi:hypothetical protein